MSKTNGKKKTLAPTPRDLSLASAIGQAVSDHLNPQLAKITATLERIETGHGKKLDSIDTTLGEHGKKLDQLIAGTVGIGRMTKLEERVTQLEQRLPRPSP